MNPLPFLLQIMPLVAFIGIGLLIFAYDRSGLVERVRKQGTETEGTVVEIFRDPGGLFSSKEGDGEAPVVDFDTPWGNHRHYSTNYRLPCPYKLGQKVRVWYYFYKSRREVVLEDDEAGKFPPGLLRWGLAFCLLGFPFLIRKLMLLVG